MRWGPTGLGVVAVAVVTAMAGASVLTVDCSGGADYLTVQDAVDAAADRDTLLIAPCLYAEEVLVTGKALTLIGSGADNTELRSLGGAEALEIALSGSSGGPFQVVGMSIVRVPANRPTLRWGGGKLVLRDCIVSGRASTDGVTEGHAEIVESRMTSLVVGAGNRVSVTENSRIDYALFVGAIYGPSHFLQSSNSVFGHLALSGCEASSACDSIGTLVLSGDSDRWDRFSGDQGTIGSIQAGECAQVWLTGSAIADLQYLSWWETWPSLSLSDCLVTGDLTVSIPSWSSHPSAVSFGRRDTDPIGIEIEHCTVIGEFGLEVGVPLNLFPRRHVRGNIVQGSTVIDLAYHYAVISHNDFAGGASVAAPGDSVYANIEADPLFCGASSEDFRLQECSPCVGSAHDGSNMGRYQETCECLTTLQAMSWGAVKARFR